MNPGQAPNTGSGGEDFGPRTREKFRLAAAEIEGIAAAKGGVVVGDNPYHEDDDRHWSWMAGWTSYRMDKLKSKT